MSRVRSSMMAATVLVLGTTLLAAAQAQAAEGSRRGAGRFMGRGSLIGLLSIEQVQKELKLSEEQTAKVQKAVEAIRTEMREQFSALREIEDRAQQRAKMTELSGQMDQKAREQLRDVLERGQVMRLYQIRMQVSPAVDSLSNRFVAGRLELTDEQKEKLGAIGKEMQAKQTEAMSALRDLPQGERAEAFQKFRKLRSDAEEGALAVLTAEQKEAFGKMKGEKFELQMRRGPR